MANVVLQVFGNVYLFWSVTEHMSLQDGSRLGRVCRTFADHWAYTCRHRLLPRVLDMHARDAIPACSPHGPRITLAVAVLLDDLPPPPQQHELLSAVDVKYAMYGGHASVARILAHWLVHGRHRDASSLSSWPSLPAALYGDSLQHAEDAANRAGPICIAAATLAYVVMAVPFLLRKADNDGGRSSPPPLVPAEGRGIDQARAFVVQNGMYFTSGAIDAIVHRTAYLNDAQNGGIVGDGRSDEREAWLCAARYLRRVDVMFPPPTRPSIAAGMSGGIGRQAWHQTVLTPAYTACLSAWQKASPEALARVTVPPLSIRVVRVGSTLVLTLPNVGCVCKLRQRWLDGLWVAKWMQRALDLTNGAVPLRCRVLQSILCA